MHVLDDTFAHIYILIQTRQNVVDVNYHITQYWHIIDELNNKVESLQTKLDQQQSTTVPSESEGGDLPVVTELCEKLKAYSQEEKEIRSVGDYILTDLSPSTCSKVLECIVHVTVLYYIHYIVC